MQDLPLFTKYTCAKKPDEKLCNQSLSCKVNIPYNTEHAAMYIGSGYHSFMADIRKHCKLKVGTEQFKYSYK